MHIKAISEEFTQINEKYLFYGHKCVQDTFISINGPLLGLRPKFCQNTISNCNIECLLKFRDEMKISKKVKSKYLF